MALADGGAIGTNNTKTSGTTLAITTTASCAVGDIIVVQHVTDNSVTTVGVTSTHTGVTDSAGNTYTKVNEVTYSAGSASDGCTLSVWRTVVTSALASGGTITCTRSGSIAARACSARKFTRTTGSSFTYTVGPTASESAVPSALTMNSLSATDQHLIVRVCAVESSNASMSAATDGTWILGADVGTSGGGGAATQVSTRAEYKIATGTSFTSQPSGSILDGTSIMFAVSETVKSITAVPGAYGLTGTAATLGAQKKIIASPGSFTLTGTATVKQVRAITQTLTPATYTQSGTAAALKAGRKATLTPGTYSLTGTATVSQKRAITATLTPGTYTQTGTATISHLFARKTIMVPGSYSYTGTNPNLAKGFKATLTPGTYTSTGTATVKQVKGWRIIATPGSYSVSGTSTVKQFRSIFLSTASGVYTLVGEGVTKPYKPTLLLSI